MNRQMIGGYELSSQQKRLWILMQERSIHHAGCAVVLEGALKINALRDAIRQVIDRHEILRTTFHRQRGISFPLQIISDSSFSNSGAQDTLSFLQSIDLSNLNVPQQTARVAELFQGTSARPFNDEDDPPVRFVLIKLSYNKHMLFICVSPLCADAHSLQNIVRDLSRSYASGLGRQEAVNEPIQYADYAEWSRQLMEDEDAERGKEFWLGQRALSPPALKLPFERRSHPPRQFTTGVLKSEVAPALSRRLEAWSDGHGIAVSVFAQACWQALLWRLLRLPVIVIGYMCDGRTLQELEDAVGLLARCVPVRCEVRDELRFTDLLAQVNERTRESQKWQEYWLWNEDARPDASHHSVVSPDCYPAIFEFEQREEGYAGGDVRFTIQERQVCAEPSKLKLNCISIDRGHERALVNEFHYDTGVYAKEAVECLSAQYEQLLESALRQPEATIGRLRISCEAERERLRLAPRRAQRDYGGSKLIHQLFREQAERTPERTAVVYEDERISYRELEAKASQLAHYLRERGVGAEVVVPLCIEPSIELIVGVLGILQAGGAYAPLDSEQPAARLASMLEQLDSPVLLTEERLREKFKDAKAHKIVIDTDWDEIARRSSAEPHATVHEENLAYVIFTSGSTGQPKGVGVEHRQLSNYVHAINERVEFPEGASYATVTTIAADLGNTMIFPALLSGGTLHLIAADRAKDAAALAEYLTRHGIDCLKIVPSHLKALQGHGRIAELLPRARLILGGESSCEEWVERFQGMRPECEVYNHYGPTETTVGVTVKKFERRTTQSTSTAAATTEETPATLGRALGNVEVYVLDKECELVSTGEAGELYIGGAAVSRGYFSEPKLTAEKFVPNPFGAAGGRLYRTGDIVRYLPDGEIEFIGRADEQVKFHGHRIELNEIRHALNQHPRVRDSVIKLMRDGAGREALLAYYVATEELEAGALREFLGRSLVRQVIPSYFLRLARMPLNANGKVDSHALPTLEEARRRNGKQTLNTPRTPLEEMLAEIWSDALGVEGVSVNDNFFDLGGHSLLLVQVHGRLMETLKIDITVVELFKHTTIASLARRLSEQTEEHLLSRQSLDRAATRRTLMTRQRLLTRTQRLSNG